MELKLSVVCLVFLTIWRITDAETTETNTSKKPNQEPVNKLIDEHDDHNPITGQDGLQESKHPIEAKLSHSTNDTNITKVQNLSAKPKSAQVLPNLASAKKPGMSKTPIFVKISNVKPAPTNLKTQAIRRKHPQINFNQKEVAPRRKVAAPYKAKPKATVVIKKVKQPPPKKTQFYEEEGDHDDIIFTPVTKLPSTTEVTKPTSDSVLLKRLKNNELKVETGISLQKDVKESKDENPVKHTEKMPKHPDSPETDDAESSKAHQHDIPLTDESKPHRTPTIEPKEEEPASSATKKELHIARTTNVPEISKTSNATENIVVSRTHPISDEADELPEVITIRNYEHKELEERYGGGNPDGPDETNIDQGISQKWTPITNTFPDSGHQSVNEQNVGNEYPYSGDVATSAMCEVPQDTLKSDYTQDYAMSNVSPSEVQMYPNVFHDWPQLQNNAMWSQTQNNAIWPPQNSVMWPQLQNYASPILSHPKVAGRTWKTWTDTEINIRKLNNKLNSYGNNLFNPVAVNVPVSYKNPVIALNGYYDNLNNQFTYPSYR